MKKVVLFFAFLSIGAFSAKSQIVELVDESNVVYGTSANAAEELSVHWSVVNATAGAVNINCKRWVIQEVAGSLNKFCWGDYCFTWGTDVANEAILMAAGTSNSTFHGYYRHQGNPGQTIVAYCFYDYDNPSNEFCYDVNYCVDGECVVGVQEGVFQAESFDIAPNPIAGTGAFTYAFTTRPENAKISIYNSLGAIVKVIDLTTQKGAVLIDARDFETGVYFCSLEANGQVFKTSRLMISK
jgi:Secretion system C-terminal sorting domain